MINKKSDNRMQWVIVAEESEKTNNEVYFSEYEIYSEVRITGRLNYGNDTLQCYLLEEKDKNGLYTYAIRVKHVEKVYEFDKNNFSQKGYYFKDGLIGELIAIFSVYFQTRFYLKASIMELSSSNHKLRTANNFNYNTPNPFLNAEMFSNVKRNWAYPEGLTSFLDTIRTLDQQYHQNLIRAFYWYSEAIKEIGIDHHLFFIKMVSSIESLLQFINAPQDTLTSKMNKLIDQNTFNKDEQNLIYRWLSNRQIRQRFSIFLSQYSINFFKGGKRKAKHCHIHKKELNTYAKRIYDARSAYLHNGTPMYLSQYINGKHDKFWDLDASCGMMADRKKFKATDKLPRVRWFERIVNHSLKNFITHLICLGKK